MKNQNSKRQPTSLYRATVSPLQVQVSNTTKKTKNIKVFGSAFNEFENIDIVPSQMNVSYSLLQKQLLSTSYEIGLIRLQTDAKSSRKLRNLVISLCSFDGNGQSCTIPIIVKSFFRRGQAQKSIIDIDYPIKLNSKVELSMDVPANTRFTITLFPDVVKNIDGTRIYGNGLITEIYNIKHSFASILYNKCNEAKNIKNELISSRIQLSKEYGVNDIENKLNNIRNLPFDEYISSLDYIVNRDNYVISEKIESLLIDLHNMPCDLYRNMVNLYVELDKYILSASETIKANGDKIKQLKIQKRKIKCKILARGKLVKVSKVISKKNTVPKNKILDKNNTSKRKTIKK